MRISDWSSDVCSSDLARHRLHDRRASQGDPDHPGHDDQSSRKLFRLKNVALLRSVAQALLGWLLCLFAGRFLCHPYPSAMVWACSRPRRSATTTASLLTGAALATRTRPQIRAEGQPTDTNLSDGAASPPPPPQ